MTPELQSRLFAKYPKIFRDRTLPMTQTCMCWGLECGDGWYAILDHLCYALTWTYSTGLTVDEAYVPVEPPQVIADQVKEKYGTLRFYYHLDFDPALSALCDANPEVRQIMDRYHSYFDGIVHMAETMSGRTCEATGREGELHVSGGTRYGWLATVNRDHAKTDEKYAARGYVPASDLKEEAE